jgi:hypothetical protein
MSAKLRQPIARCLWAAGWKLIQISGVFSGQEWLPPVPRGPTGSWEISSPHDDGSILITKKEKENDRISWTA